MNILPGFRIIKTSIAVFVCLIIGKLLNFGFPIYALLSCVLMMKESTDLTIKYGIDRSIGTAFGGIIAIIIQAIVLNLNIDMNSYTYITIIALTILLTLSLGRVFGLNEYAMSMASILVVLILCSYNTTLRTSILYSIDRIAETIVGIVIAVVVNLSVKPYKKKKRELD